MKDRNGETEREGERDKKWPVTSSDCRATDYRQTLSILANCCWHPPPFSRDRLPNPFLLLFLSSSLPLCRLAEGEVKSNPVTAV